MTAQRNSSYPPPIGSLEDLTPAGGLIAIIAGILISVMVGPTLSGPLLGLEQIIVYGIGVVLIIAGGVSIYTAYKKTK
ncbi:MAG: hypothetical protein QXG73_02885 [Candidatus Micrarchaeaceae archaeon]